MRRPLNRSRLVVLLTASALIGSSFAVSAPASAAQPGQGPGARFQNAGGKSGGADGHGTRGKVNPRELSTKAPTKRPTMTLDRPALRGSAAGEPTTSPRLPSIVAPAPAQAIETSNPPAARPGQSGINSAGPFSAGEPPDPFVAVGPDHVVQVTNVAFKIFDRSGVDLYGDMSLADFFLLPLPGPGKPDYFNSDPRVHYDSLHGRWLMTELSWTCDELDGHAYGFIDVLVSDSADPRGNWTLWYWYFTDALPDYPALGTSTDKIGLGANVFALPVGCASTEYIASDIIVFDWADLLAEGDLGVPNRLDFGQFYNSSLYFFTPRIAVQAPATSPVLHTILQYDDPADGLPDLHPYYLTITGSAVAHTVAIPVESDLTLSGVAAVWVEPPPPQQPDLPTTVTDKIDSRPTDAIWQGSRLAFVSNHGCTPAGDDTLRACVRVTEIRTSAAGTSLPTRVQDFLIAANGKHNYFGGIGFAANGTLFAAWTRSSIAPGDYASSMAAYQIVADANNRISPPEVLQSGLANYDGPAGGRWGDYVGVAQDPQVPNAVWQGNQYSGGGSSWLTYVSQLQTGGSSYVPIPPVRVLDTRPAYNIGLSGTFKANIPRTFAVGGASGIPADAIAVTGNVTIANQTGAGYLSVTPTANVNPTSSTINFPLGDTRANNLTVPLATNGKLAAVYKAPAGKTTHVILDITGYFLAGDANSTYATLTPVRVLDTRPAYKIGLTGPFGPGNPRKLQVAGTNDIPADATAITGNLTVVGQTKAGYLSITTTSVANPTTSNLNFPLGDTRANGVSVPLNPTGALWIVYKASGGSTHVILDVTGYYRDDPSGLLFYPLTPGRVLDSRPGKVLSGLTGPFKSSTPRRLDITGHWGAPLSASAVTGNLTVVGQQAAGYVSATLTSEANPTTSVLNFPLGDVRANGVTLPLNVGGRSWFVYKASSGKLTHLVLDLSGYFD